MKKIIRSFTALLLNSFLFAGCQNSYKEIDGAIYYNWSNGATMKSENNLVKEADVATFESIKNKGKAVLGKDKNHVYKEGEILEFADPKTFESINEWYWKDKDKVFFLSVYGNKCVIENADPKTFEVLKNFWAADKNNVYYIDKTLLNTDIKTLEPIDKDWAKDNQSYYYQHLKVNGLDYKTAQILSPYYIKDAKQVFFENKLVKDADAKTFKADDFSGFGHDAKNMFYNEKNEGAITKEYKKAHKIK